MYGCGLNGDVKESRRQLRLGFAGKRLPADGWMADDSMAATSKYGARNWDPSLRVSCCKRVTKHICDSTVTAAFLGK